MKQGAAGNVIVLQPTKTAMTFCDIDLPSQRTCQPCDHSSNFCCNNRVRLLQVFIQVGHDVFQKIPFTDPALYSYHT